MSDAPVALPQNDNASAPPQPPAAETLKALLGFVDPADVNRAYESSGWNVEKYVKRLVMIIEDEDTAPRVALAAAEILRLHGESVLRISGRDPEGDPKLLSGNVAAEILPAADLALLENRAARTRSMLKKEDSNGDAEQQQQEEVCSDEGAGKDGSEDAEGSGGAESGTGQVSTEEVIGHRPSAGTRRGLCGPEPDGGGSP